MSDVTINYKDSTIATVDASGTKTLLTKGKYCEDDIEVIYVKPSGGTTFPYTNCNSLFYVGTDKVKPIGVGTKIVMDLPNCVSVSGMLGQYIATDAYNAGIEEAEITLYHEVAASSFLYRNTSIQRIVFPNGIIINARPNNFASGASALKSIIGAIDISHVLSFSVDGFNLPVLEDIEFVNNCISYSLNFSSSVLTDTSLVSIANGLNESATGQTLTMVSAVKTRMDALIGTVSVPSGETYHVFTSDASGNISLSDFVTTTKGWTLATS